MGSKCDKDNCCFLCKRVNHGVCIEEEKRLLSEAETEGRGKKPSDEKENEKDVKS